MLLAILYKEKTKVKNVPKTYGLLIYWIRLKIKYISWLL